MSQLAYDALKLAYQMGRNGISIDRLEDVEDDLNTAILKIQMTKANQEIEAKVTKIEKKLIDLIERLEEQKSKVAALQERNTRMHDALRAKDVVIKQYSLRIKHLLHQCPTELLHEYVLQLIGSECMRRGKKDYVDKEEVSDSGEEDSKTV